MESARVGAAPLALLLATFAALAAPAAAQVSDFGVRDPGAGTISEYVFPPAPDCPGTHDVEITFVTHTVRPRLGRVPWLTIPATVTCAGEKPSVGVLTDLAGVGSGKYQGLVMFRCTGCWEAECTARPHVESVVPEVAAPATFGASPADAGFGGGKERGTVLNGQLSVDARAERAGITWVGQQRGTA